MAGGGPKAGSESGEYNTTQFAKQGDRGSKVLPYTPTGTVWTAGELAETAWYIRANHGVSLLLTVFLQRLDIYIQQEY